MNRVLLPFCIALPLVIAGAGLATPIFSVPVRVIGLVIVLASSCVCMVETSNRLENMP